MSDKSSKTEPAIHRGGGGGGGGGGATAPLIGDVCRDGAAEGAAEGAEPTNVNESERGGGGGGAPKATQ